MRFTLLFSSLLSTVFVQYGFVEPDGIPCKLPLYTLSVFHLDLKTVLLTAIPTPIQTPIC